MRGGKRLQPNRHKLGLRVSDGLTFPLTSKKEKFELDPVGSTVRYEMMKLCTGSAQDTMRRQQLVIGDTGSVEAIYAFIY